MTAWTVMVYMAGDNSLSAAADEDLAELRRVGSTADVAVLVEVDRAGPDRATERLRVERDGIGERIEALGETDSGDPDALRRFVAWAVAAAPAERYALVLWNHGGGWAPAELDRLAAGPPAAPERGRAGVARLLFRGSVGRILGLPTPRERAICADDGSGHSLDTVELGRVLADVHARLGRPLDLLGMDACLMSNLEVAYEVRDHARVIVASEDTEPGGGWPYDVVARAFAEAPQATTAALAARIVAAYGPAHAAAGPRARLTQSALDSARLGELSAPLDALADAGLASLAARAPEIWAAQRRALRFCQDTLWDLRDFAERLAATSADPVLTAAATQVAARLAVGSGPLLAAMHRGPGLERCGGLSVYLPALQDVSPFYAELAFAAAHRWPAFLAAYRRALVPAAGAATVSA